MGLHGTASLWLLGLLGLWLPRRQWQPHTVTCDFSPFSLLSGSSSYWAERGSEGHLLSVLRNGLRCLLDSRQGLSSYTNEIRCHVRQPITEFWCLRLSNYTHLFPGFQSLLWKTFQGGIFPARSSGLFWEDVHIFLDIIVHDERGVCVGVCWRIL